jgi:hypothetical protein
VYDTQNHWVDFVHRPEFRITRQHNVSENGSVSVFRWGEGDTYCEGPFSKSNDSHYLKFTHEVWSHCTYDVTSLCCGHSTAASRLPIGEQISHNISAFNWYSFVPTHTQYPSWLWLYYLITVCHPESAATFPSYLLLCRTYYRSVSVPQFAS